MPRRFAAVAALSVFAFCLVLGIQAGNSFATVIARSLVAMVATFVLGLCLGVVALRMLDENLKTEEQKLKSQPDVVKTDR